MSFLKLCSSRIARTACANMYKSLYQRMSYTTVSAVNKHITSFPMKQVYQQQQGSFFHTSSLSMNAFQISELTDDNYHRISDNTFNQMVDILEAIGDETDLEGFDLEYSQGVMTLNLGEHGTYVINKQPPNKQIWLSSPKSGPKRYDYDATQQKWFYGRDNHTLDELLNKELSDILGEVDVLEGLEHH
ncbi:hypothetical protein BCR42DRAFT_415689 [Absidia repens]|uniref:ferroxidase n=1 Tax=Absidia repens TaxID=90262 RepID=A0A1X2IFV8_9FUNG|nr:hypothetical protein BCR42DRAFT_415689 [Absidia repens]